MPDRVALCLGEATLTYRELGDASDRVSGPPQPAPGSIGTPVTGVEMCVVDDALKTAPTELGGPGLPTLADAPGTYVFDN